MESVTERPRFHLAIAVDDLEAASDFYGDVLGCARGRADTDWIDWNLYGHQLVTHRAVRSTTSQSPSPHNFVDGHEVPVPHFGLILTIDLFHLLALRLKEHRVNFVIEPYVRFIDEPGEQWTMFFCDPAGNAIECKAFARENQVFAT